MQYIDDKFGVKKVLRVKKTQAQVACVVKKVVVSGNVNKGDVTRLNISRYMVRI
jgi:hypothetical protein